MDGLNIDFWAAVTIAFWAVAMVGSGLKGKWWFVVLAVVLPGFVFVTFAGALRVAKPESLWARVFYDENEMLHSIERFSTPGQFEEFESRMRAKNQGRTGFGGNVDPELAAYGKIGASKEEIGEIAPPIN